MGISLEIRAGAERERRRRQAQGETITAPPAPDDWRERVPLLFHRYFWHPFSKPHEELWTWQNAIALHSTPRPFTAFWSRGRGKSTNAEAAVADLGASGRRTYCMYVCGTQDQADKHVGTISRMLESDEVARHYPDMARPRLGKNGSRSWNRQIVTTAGGFTVEAVGLNKAVRGQKIDWARPDLIVFDDVDEKHDTEAATKKKREIITESILPAGSVNCAVLFLQNLIHADSIATTLSRKPGTDGAADFLMNRLISGPFPAVAGLKYEARTQGDITRWVITEGRSLWNGFDLAICEEELTRYGPTSFLLESQHEVDGDNENALLTAADFERTRRVMHPELVTVAIAVDPPGGATECGIVVGGKARIGNEWHGFTIEDNSQPPGCKPEQWALAVLQSYYRHKADVVYVERNYGGDMVAATLRQTVWRDDEGNVILDGKTIKIEEVTATRGKRVRAEPVAVVFQQGRGHHVGQFPALEKEWRQWVPGDAQSPNRLDAEVWLYTGLGLLTGSAIGLQIGSAKGWGVQ